MKKRKAIWQEAPFLVGGILTIGVLAIAALSLTTGEMCDQIGRCTSKWDVLLASPPNEIGDALAGFAGTLAFVWLIVTVWLQATELREQRDEFEKMANAQEAQVSLLVKQGEIFADEQRQRDEIKAANLFSELLSNVEYLFKTCRIHIRADDGSPDYGSTLLVHFSLKMHDSEEKIERHLRRLSHELPEEVKAVQLNVIDAEVDFFPMGWQSEFAEALDILKRMSEIQGRLSEEQERRLEVMRIEHLISAVTKLLSMNIWKSSPQGGSNA